MKKFLILIVCAAVGLMIPSCQNPKNSEEYKQLQAENDSLKFAGLKQSGEYSEMLGLINEVEDNFRKIKETENYLTEQSQAGGELSRSTKERITDDMQLLTATLQKNKEQIQKLQNQLKSSGIKSAELTKRLSQLTQEVEEKTKSIAALQEQLEKQNLIIAEQGEKIQAQSTAIEQQKTAITQQGEQISAQDKSLNTGYYVFGTKKELEEEKILVKGKLMQQGYNKSYFTQIDIRNIEQVPLYTKKAKMLSVHPASSYVLEKTADGNLTLTVLNKKDFWSISRYLVIQVD
ncbi:MAG: hypothetical protein FWF54_00975 [Candidatus Azobacteroides sp.]|nr:hypothetical protein [Candidatus Azobacteroides sp.]